MNRITGSWVVAAILSIALGVITGGCTPNGFVQPSAERAEAVNQALKATLDLPVTTANSVALRLMRQEYDQIETEYRLAFENYQKDVLYESPLHKGYELFFPGNSVVPKYLDAWVDATGSDIAYTARGFYYLNQASSARGTEFIKNTPPEQLREMQRYCETAAADFDKAVQKNPALSPAWVGLIRVAMMANTPFSAHDVFAAAVEKNDRSFYLRQQYMAALEPRWGGSYELMAAFAMFCAEDVGLNPRFWSIVGTIYADQANAVGLEGKHDLAVELYTKALAYGDKLDWLQYRSNSLMLCGEYERAIADAERILYYSPEHQKATALLSRIRQLKAQQG